MQAVEIIEIEKKGPVLGRPRFGCLAGSFGLNLSRGCAFSCVYCYARGYPDAPPLGTVLLYRDVPGRLAAELDNPRRRSRVEWVALNTASDCFQPHPEVLEAAYGAMSVLMDRGVRFSFLTKGAVPERFLRLFAGNPALVEATVCLVSAAREHRDAYEPGAAGPEERLETLRRLRLAGLRPEVRVDPVIPFVSDGERSIRELYAGIAAAGVTSLSVSYLHLRPRVLEILREELPAKQKDLVLGAFGPLGAGSSPMEGELRRTRLLPKALRTRGYERFLRLAPEFGLTARVCACKNPDLPGEPCSAAGPLALPPKRRGREQLPLFPL